MAVVDGCIESSNQTKMNRKNVDEMLIEHRERERKRRTSTVIRRESACKTLRNHKSNVEKNVGKNCQRTQLLIC